MCPECEGWPALLVRARSAALLAHPADDLVHAFKYEGWKELAGELARRMVSPGVFPWELASDTPIIPVPTTRERERERGYNQAAALAREVAVQSGFPFMEALQRSPGKGSQVALHRSERKANVSGAFAVLPEAVPHLSGRGVILVDDVLTTGATAGAVTEALEGAGVTAVTLLTYARALPALNERASP